MAREVIGVDVGGANTKAALVRLDGSASSCTEPLEVWQDPGGLAPAIARVVERVRGAPGAPVALTTTAELVDVFESKRAGVLRVLAAAQEALPGRRLSVMTTDGALVDVAQAAAEPLRCAAANWVATALLAAREARDAVLVDCGGTTTDVIPVAGGSIAARGRTDLERLRHGELLYTGALRTNVAAVVSSVPVGGASVPVASELFAVTADAHLRLHHLRPRECTCTFPDGRGPAPVDVERRLARVVCADPEELGPGDVDAIAGSVFEAQVAAIAQALSRVAARSGPDAPVLSHGPARGGPGAPVLAVGVGAFLARAAAARVGLECAPPGSLAFGGDVAPAVALSILGRG